MKSRKITSLVVSMTIALSTAATAFTNIASAQMVNTTTEYSEDFESYGDVNYQNTLLGLKDYDWYMADDTQLYTNVSTVPPYSTVANYKLAKITTTGGHRCLQVFSPNESYGEEIAAYGYGKTFPGVDAGQAATGVWEIDFDFKPYLNGGRTQFAVTMNAGDGSASDERTSRHNIIAGYGTDFFIGHRNYNTLLSDGIKQGTLPAARIGGVIWYRVKTILNCDERYYSVELYNRDTGELIARRSPISLDPYAKIGFLKFSALGYDKPFCLYVDNISIKQTTKDAVIYNETFDNFQNGNYTAADGITTATESEDYSGDSYFEGYTPWKFHQNVGSSYAFETASDLPTESQVVRLGDIASTEDKVEESGLIYMQSGDNLLDRATEYQRGLLKTSFKIKPQKIVDDVTINIIPNTTRDITSDDYAFFRITNHENTPCFEKGNGEYAALDASVWYNADLVYDAVNHSITTTVNDLDGNEIASNTISGVTVPYALKAMMFKVDGGSSVLMDDIRFEYYMPAPSIDKTEITLTDRFGNDITSVANVTTALKTIEIPVGCLADAETTEAITLKDNSGDNVPYTGTISGNTYTIDLDGILELNKEYTLTIPKTLANIFGDKLGEDITFTFATTKTAAMQQYMEISSVTADNAPVADLSDITPGSTINVVTSYANNTEKAVYGNAILAFYNDNKLIETVQTLKTTAEPLTIGADDSSLAFTVPATLDMDTVDEMSIFLWDGLQSANPLSEKITYTKAEADNYEEYVDFVVNVEGGRDAVVLHLSDTQIQDSSQLREDMSLNADATEFWSPENMDERLFNDLSETIEAVNPDLILLTGDLVYGRYDDAGTSFTKLADFIDGYDIPWAPVFGNHDNESVKGADWQCDYLENCENCLFDQKTLTGNGNYSIGIVQNGKLNRVVFMLDSNACGGMSSETEANGHSKKTSGFGDDQIDWYSESAHKINTDFEDVKYTFAFHIQIAAFEDALHNAYGFVSGGDKRSSGDLASPINIDEREDKQATDFGYLGRDPKGPWDKDRVVFNGMKALGVDSILVGHEHCNSASVVFDGIRFQYAQKIGEYDRVNFVAEDGTITGAGANNTFLGTPIIGGTVLHLSESTGEIDNAYIYYCDK